MAETLKERDARMLGELEDEKLQLLERRSRLDPWSNEWDQAKARYQEIERRMRVIAVAGTRRYNR